MVVFELFFSCFMGIMDVNVCWKVLGFGDVVLGWLCVVILWFCDVCKMVKIIYVLSFLVGILGLGLFVFFVDFCGEEGSVFKM